MNWSILILTIAVQVVWTFCAIQYGRNQQWRGDKAMINRLIVLLEKQRGK